MSTTISITEQQLYGALGAFLTSVVLAGTGVYQSQINRVAEPAEEDFVLMNSTTQQRLAGNVDAAADALFTGSIAGTVLTITSVNFGVIAVGSPVLGVGIAANTVVTGFGTGTGGVGTYAINTSQTITSQKIACGMATKVQSLQVSVQLDVHGPQSADNATIITTMFRDEYGVDKIAATGFDIAPLYAEEPRQIPFVNEAQQVEQRWVIIAMLQCKPLIAIPQEYADAVTVTLVDVDANYAP